jgi:hypothetical protein
MAIVEVKHRLYGLIKRRRPLSEGEKITTQRSRLWGATDAVVLDSKHVVQEERLSDFISMFKTAEAGCNGNAEEHTIFSERAVRDIKIQRRVWDVLAGRRTTLDYVPDPQKT